MQETNFDKNRTAVIKDIIQLTREKYVYPEIGGKIASEIESNLENGSYDDITNENRALHPVDFRFANDI